MIPSEPRPLISFVLAAYNQERFIREAVAGALCQSYSPLEIILSDDCSTDGTFALMQTLAAGYGGPHRIVFNRNPRNLGIGAHLNRIMELAHGELVVGAAGDDISLPQRTEEIYRAWIDSGKTAFSLDSEYELIDEDGAAVGAYVPRRLPELQQLLHFSLTLTNYAHGCTHAWNRKVFDVFGPLPDIICEDVAIPPRSMMLGRVVHIAKPLVRYRTHQGNVQGSSQELSAAQNLERTMHYLKDQIAICADVTRCIEQHKRTLKDPPAEAELDQCLKDIRRGREKLALKVEILTGTPLFRVYPLLKYIFLFGLQKNELFLVACAFSKTMYRILRDGVRSLRPRLT